MQNSWQISKFEELLLILKYHSRVREGLHHLRKLTYQLEEASKTPGIGTSPLAVSQTSCTPSSSRR